MYDARITLKSRLPRPDWAGTGLISNLDGTAVPDEGQVFGQRQLDKSGALKYVNSGGATQPLKLSEQRTAPFVRLLFQEVRNGRTYRSFGLAACARLDGAQRGLLPRLVPESGWVPSSVRKLLRRAVKCCSPKVGRVFVAASGSRATEPS